MCGRARCTVGVDDVGRTCGFSGPLRTLDSDRFNPSYNVSPGRYMPVVRRAAQPGDSAKDSDSMEPVVQCMRWGLIPSFTKKNEKLDFFRMFNARSESVHVKPSFSRLLPKGRCLTTVEGFYEWKKDGAKKQPYYVHFEDGHPLVFACLYDSWKDEEGNVLFTFTILTTRSSKALDWLHDRMPVILPNEAAINSWLNDDLKEPEIHKLTQPYEASDLVWYPVTPAMGKPAFDSPECAKEIKPKVASESKIAKLFEKVHTESDANVEPEGSTDHVTSGPQVPEEGIPGTISEIENEDSLNEYERKSLLAGVLPDHDIAQDLLSEQQEDTISGDFVNLDSKSSPQSEKSEVPVEKSAEKGRMQTRNSGKAGQTQLYSPVKPDRKDSPSAKRQRLAESPKMANKKGGHRQSKNTQSNLLSFFGKT